MSDIRRRALVAAAVATCGAFVGVAGAGHAYLREWRRAFAWFSCVVGACAALVVAFVDLSTLDPATVDPATLPPEVQYPILGLLILSTLDAYSVAARSRDGGVDVVPCPHCGRALDEDLAFCPWCADPLGDVEADA